MSELPSDEDWLLAHSQFVRESNGGGRLKVLDLGCGRGRDAVHLVEFGEVIAADQSEEALTRCRDSVPGVTTVCLNIAQPFPFADGQFDFVLASLSLHYFSWVETQRAVAEMRRCLRPQGRSIVRLNSINDVNYGAGALARDAEIEPGYVRVWGQKKRFFDDTSVRALFAGWQVRSMRELTINRYEKHKVVWEVLLKVEGSDA